MNTRVEPVTLVAGGLYLRNGLFVVLSLEFIVGMFYVTCLFSTGVVDTLRFEWGSQFHYSVQRIA
jgi:hypothetical protein